jgi:flagellar biosynthesis/type III secretory pathway protein FliH
MKKILKTWLYELIGKDVRGAIREAYEKGVTYGYSEGYRAGSSSQQRGVILGARPENEIEEILKAKGL